MSDVQRRGGALWGSRQFGPDSTEPFDAAEPEPEPEPEPPRGFQPQPEAGVLASEQRSSHAASQPERTPKPKIKPNRNRKNIRLEA
ncbi:hypothetical protein EVG20_g6459 [Dentipellis fragilis]|uniref:Uncharacterized protein n=1 Tax=Dentipellis fragilis TaxID=205917 RepID=A0A4Y9YL03_9AGAM|nr:hypothetical protein EVG20_g6459 [Dentipellis fragilis]